MAQSLLSWGAFFLYTAACAAAFAYLLNKSERARKTMLSLLGVGLFAIFKASALPFGSLSEPDSGLFPVVIAVVLVLFSALSLGNRERPPVAATAERAGIVRVLVLIAALCAYAWFLPRAGFLIR